MTKQVLQLQLPQDCFFIVACLLPLVTGSAHKKPGHCLQVTGRESWKTLPHLYPFLAGNPEELRVGDSYKQGSEARLST